MDIWEFGSLLSALGINFGVFWQLYHIIKTKKSDGLSLSAWAAFAILLGYMAIFSFVKNQHFVIVANYVVSTIAHTAVTIFGWKYRSTKMKKIMEIKLAEQYMTKELVLEAYGRLEGPKFDMSCVPEVGNIIFNMLMGDEIYGIVEKIGKRDFNFDLFKKEIIKGAKPYIQEIVEEKSGNTKLPLG